MRVEQLMARPVQLCRPTDSLASAAQQMWDHDCGCLPVVSSNGESRVVGVITDRDICMCALFQGRPLQELRVDQAMARQVHVCRPGDTLAEVEKIMREAQIRRLPVVDDQGALAGIISLADLAQEAAKEQRSSRPEITEIEIGDTLAAICEPVGRQLVA
jgi:CBS domain-containing protein